MNFLKKLDHAAFFAVLIIPLGMLHAFALAEAGIALVVANLLVRSVVLRDWGWAGSFWFRVAAVWWGWLILCSVPGIGQGGFDSFVQSIVVGRYLLFVAALEHHVLAPTVARAWLGRVITACALYIGGQTLIQFVTGHNLGGYPRWGDGELTGPFQKPRAGAPYSRMFAPAFLPAICDLLARKRVISAAGAAIVALGVAILIGQRMPVMLTVLALLICALLLRELRAVAISALVAGALLLAASAVVAPPTFYRLVTKFSSQMETLPESNYGQLAARAVTMAGQHPWMGRGFNGFRTGCADPSSFHGWHWATDKSDDGGGLAGCNIHPHNHYLQAVTDAGIPGLVLFSAMVLAWLGALGRGLWQRPTPIRVALFASAVIAQWPLASTSSAFAIEIGGLFFLLLGWGLAEARAAGATPAR